ncbi:MAG: deoxyhypusine synthase family protein [Nitrososphaeraceae archaeon]
MNNKHTFTGKKIDPPDIYPNMSISDIISFYGSTGFNARRLSEAANMFKKMIDSEATICLTISGAMTPIGLGKSISTLIEKGFIDWIITTGANAYHDLHFAYDLPVRQGHFDVDDDILYSKQIVRIYDVYIKELETLQRQDYLIQNIIKKMSKSIDYSVKDISTSDLSYKLGESAYNHSSLPDKSFMVSAFKHKLPVYIPSLTDSSIGMNMIPLLFESSLPSLNLLLDIAESAAILWKSKISGGIELGGGVPKNFFQQTGPTLYQILKIKEGGHDYVIQLTDARPDTGGLSGATIQEGKSWGKIKTSHTGNVIVYGDSSVYFPLLCSYVLSECKPRKPKKLYQLKDEFVKEMKDNYLKKIRKKKKVNEP